MSLIETVDTLPRYIYDDQGSNKEKIVKFNHYIKQIEIIENPDLIVVGIPGNLVEISKKVIGDFGSSAYIISKSVRPDYVISNFPYFIDFQKKYMEILYYIENRIEAKVNACNIIPQYLDLLESEESGDMEYIDLSIEFVEQKIPKSNQFYFTQEDTEISRIVTNIETVLESYADIEIV